MATQDVLLFLLPRGDAWIGKFLLQVFGVSESMLQAAGGLILLRVGMRLESALILPR